MSDRLPWVAAAFGWKATNDVTGARFAIDRIDRSRRTPWWLFDITDFERPHLLGRFQTLEAAKDAAEKEPV